MAAKRGVVDSEIVTPKKRHKSGGTPGKQSIPSFVGTEESEDFPRGGTSSLTPLEVRKIKQEAEKDVLFGSPASVESSTKKKGKKTKKSKVTEQDNNENLTDVEIFSKSKIKFVDTLSHKKLSVGMKLLGAVKEVNELDLAVSLPNGLSGFVHITRINEKITASLKGELQAADTDVEQMELPSLVDLFQVGSLIPCVITDLESTKHGHKRIKLSADPKDVLPGYVSSVEDHGYLVSFGVAGSNGFLPKKAVETELQVGSPSKFLVKSVGGEGRVINVTIDSSEVKRAVMTDAMKLKFTSLLPGMVVRGTVTQAFSSGLSVSFLGGFEGTVDKLHLPGCGGDGQNLDEQYPKKKRVDCCIVYINSSTKKVGLSLHKSIVEGKAHEFGLYGIGDIIDGATVTRVDQGLGLLMNLSEDVKGYAHISRVSDERVEKLGKKYKCGTKHRCRILGFNSMDGVATLTMEKSVIEQPFIRYHDIKPGSIVKGTIITLEKFGMLVSVSDHIRGLCATLHLADITLKHPEKKLKEGKTVKCRVLSVNPDRRRLLLTHKKTLVTSHLQIITEYNDCTKPGTSAHGFITAIKEYGCIVTFYNNVKGLVPRTQLGIPPQEDPKAVFYIGQVVQCHVLTCQPQEKKLKLSFKADARRHIATESTGLKAGSIVDVDVVSQTPEGLDVMVQPSGFPAFVPLGHLSDHSGHWGHLLSVYGPTAGGGTSQPRRVTNVLFYGGSKKAASRVSFKQSLIKTALDGTFLTSFDDVKVDMLLPGFVKKIMNYGVFVEFANDVFGLAPNAYLADQFVTDASAHFEVGQSVMAKVTEVSTDRKRFLVSLKLSDCKPGNDAKGVCSGLDLLQDLLVERKLIMENLASKSEDIKALISFPFDSFVEAKVTGTKQHGIVLQLEHRVTGIAPHQLAHGVECTEGAIVYGCVLDHDIDKKLLYLTLSPEITEHRKTRQTKKAKKKKLKVGEAVQAIIQLVKEEYMIIALPQHGHRLAFAPTRRHLNDIRKASKQFVVGQKCMVVVRSDSEPLVVTLQDSLMMDKENIVPGVITTATVKAVKEFQINVSLCGGKFHGRVHISHIKDDITEGESPLKSFKGGDKIQVKVIGFRDVKTHKFLAVSHKNFSKAVAELSMRPSDLANGSPDSTDEIAEKSLEDYKVGEEVGCFVKSTSDFCVWTMVSTSVSGRIPLLHLSTDIKVLKKATSHFKPGSAYKCVVMGIDKSHGILDLSLTVKPDSKLERGLQVVGRISKILPSSGLLVQLPFHKCGMADLVDLQDQYEDEPLSKFQLQQFVKCYILATKGEEKFDLSLRPSRTEGVSTSNENVKDGSDGRDEEIKSLSELEEGKIVRGYVKSCSDVGVFVTLAHHLTARVQIKNLSQYFVKNWKPLFPPGKLVTGKVLSINPTKGLIELSLKGKDVGGPDPAPKPERTNEKQERKKRKRDTQKEKELKVVEASDDEAEDCKKPRKDSVSEDEELLHSELEEESEDSGECSDSSDDEEGGSGKHKSSRDVPRLQISAGFNWNAEEGENGVPAENGEAHEESSDSEPEASEQANRKKTKRQKRAAKKAEEEFLFKTEQALLDQDRAPETAEEFDRLVVSSPGSSVVWLQYMAFHLQTTEIDKARAVAERALKTIPFREEQEKLNIWVALMNLENMYGTQESLVKVFERALQQNEPKKVFLQLVDIYVRSNKMELAEQLSQTMTKRFSQSKKVWINFGLFYMKSGRVEAARKLLQRSLKSLPKRKHIETIEKFAIMEFRYGEPQRGQTVFESILSNYPKRTDLWSVYIDMMQKQGDPEPVRQIFERVIHMNLSSKKMKFFFKRYLDFERKFGDELSEEKVKTKAMEYVESKIAVT